MALISTTGVKITLDETSGLQNGSATPTPAGDADDNDTSLTLPTAFSGRLSTLLAATTPTETLIGTALSGYDGSNTGLNAFTITPTTGGTITDILFTDSAGALLNGLDSGLDTVGGVNIYLYTDTTNNNILLGRAAALDGSADPNGAIVFAAYIEETGSPSVTGGKIWTTLYQPLYHSDTSSPDDSVNLLDKVFIGTSQNTEFSLADAPSGQNLFLMFTTANPTVVDGRISGVSIIATGKDPADQSSGANITTGDTINTSQAGGPTTFGTNSQMITEQEGIRFSFVTGAKQDFTIPNLDQNEADVEANIDFTAVFGARTATFDVVQLQSGKSAQVKITALSTAAESGVNFINGYANDTTVAITNVRVINTTTGQVIENSNGTANDPNVAITFTAAGVATITGVKAGYTIEYTTTADHNRVLVENGAALNATGNTHADFDIGGFELIQVSTATTEIGSKIFFEDDGPSISTTGTEPTLTVDETVLTTDATASFAANFTSAFGADGAGTLTYALGVAAGASGLTDTATNEAVNLSLTAGGVVEGRTATTNLLVFTVSVAANGDVTLDQQRAVVHPITTDPDDSKSLTADNLVTLTATKTDGDGDSVQATINIGQNLNFEDDGPSLAFGNLVGTGTVLPQTGYWSDAAGADGLGAAGLDISLTGFQLVRPDGSIVNGTSSSLTESTPSPDGSGNFLFTGTLTGDFDNSGATPDTTVNFSLTAYTDGHYALDLVQGFGSTVTFSTANGSLPAGGPDPVQTLPIGDKSVVFFAVNPTAPQTGIESAILLGAPDYNEAYLQAHSSMVDSDGISANGNQPGDGTYSFINDTYLMNVSTSGIGVGNNVLQGDNSEAITSADESFVVNPDTLLTSMKVFIDNSVGGYNPASESLYYTIYYADGTAGTATKVLAGDLTAESGGQKSFVVNSGAGSGQLIDAVQLTMARGDIKIPVIEFTAGSENLASDVKLDFSATLTDKDGDTATDVFSADLYANELGNPTFDFILAGTVGEQDAFNIDLSSSLNKYQVVTGFDMGTDKLVLLGDATAVPSINNGGADSIVTITETGGEITTVTVVGVDLANTDVVFG